MISFLTRVQTLIFLSCCSFFLYVVSPAASSTQLLSHDEVEHSVARHLNRPNGLYRFLPTGLPSPKNGIQAGSRSETGAEGTHADKLLTFKHQPHLVQYAQSSGYGPYSKNVRDKGQQEVRTTQTRTSGMRSASSGFTSRSLLGGQSFERAKEEDQMLPPAKTHTRNPNSSYFVVKRVSLLNKTLSFPQTGKYKPSKDGGLKSDTSNVNEGPSFHPLLSPPPTHEARRALPLPTRMQYKGYKDTNELPMGEAPGFLNPGAPLPRNPLEIRQRPSPEKPSSVPNFSKTLDPMGSRRIKGHKKIILYPSKDSRLKEGEGGQINAPNQRSFAAPWYGRLNPNLEHPDRMDLSNRQSSTEHYTPFNVPAQSPSQTSWAQNFVPLRHIGTQTNHPTAPRLNSTESTQDYKPGPKRFPRIQGFGNPLRQPGKEPAGPTRRNSQMFSLPAFKTKPLLLQKYSFGPPPITPSKPEQVAGSSLSPGELSVTNLTSGSIAASFKNWPSKSKASLDRNPNQVRLYKGKFGLEGFGTRPLEGDKALLKSPEMIAPYRSGLEGLKLRSLDFWQPNIIKIIGRYNQTSSSSKKNQNNKVRGDDFTWSHETEGSNGSLNHTNDGKDIRPAKAFNRTHKRLGIPFSQIASSAHLRSEERLKTPGADDGNRPLRTFTSSTARGRPVRTRHNKKINGSTFIKIHKNSPIYRLPKPPQKVKAVTYTDIPGSASFSSIRATGVTVPSLNNTQLSNATEQTVLTGESRDGRLEAKAENKTKDLQVVAETNFDDEADDLKMPELFLRSDGNKVFNVSEVLSAVERHQNARENLLELDYLRTSTGNIFFKSLKQPSLGKQ